MTKQETVRLRLTFEVDYIPNGVSVDALKSLLRGIAEKSLNDGTVTGDTSAVVDGWTAKVSKERNI